MPPTPPVPAVTITTDPATPIDMPLATGQEQQVLLQFSRSLSWSDFIEYARFAYMYDGVIYSNVSPVTGGSGVRVDGNDGELIIDIPEWNVPVVNTNIVLEIGHKDWKLLGITYDDRYQLKPQDLIGLELTTVAAEIGNILVTGQPAVFLLNGNFIKARYNSAERVVNFNLLKCNPHQADHTTVYECDDLPDSAIISAYTCAATTPAGIGGDLKDFVIDTIGLQPAQLTDAVFEGYLDHAEVPMAITVY